MVQDSCSATLAVCIPQTVLLAVRINILGKYHVIHRCGLCVHLYGLILNGAHFELWDL